MLRFLTLFWLLLCLLPAVVFGADGADKEEDETDRHRFMIKFGFSVTDFDSTLRINSKEYGTGASIDLEDTLGYEETIRLGYTGFRWNMSGRHYLSFSFLPISRSGATTLEGDIEIDDDLIKAGSRTDSRFDTYIYDIDYSYALIKTDKHQLGLAAGIHWISAEFDLQAQGSIGFIAGNTYSNFQSDYSTSMNAEAPLPLFGLSYAWRPHPRWHVIANTKILDVSYDKYDGSLWLAEISAEYFFTERWGAGLSVGGFDMALGVDDDSRLGNFEWRYTGLNAYLVARF